MVNFKINYVNEIKTRIRTSLPNLIFHPGADVQSDPMTYLWSLTNAIRNINIEQQASDRKKESNIIKKLNEKLFSLKKNYYSNYESGK